MMRLAYAAGGALLFCSLCLAEDPPATTDATEVRGVDVKVVAETFDTNEARADLLYVGKRVAVGGEVVRVIKPRFHTGREKGKDAYLLELKLPEPQQTPVSIVFLFNEEERAALADLRAGQRVVLQGECQPPAIYAESPMHPRGNTV